MLEGSAPPGTFSLPSTAVGDGDGAVGDGDGAVGEGGDPVGEGDNPAGDAVEVGWLGDAGGGAVSDAGTVCVGDPGGGPDGEEDAGDGEGVGDGEVATALGDDVTAEIADGLGPVWPGVGPSATGRC